MSLLNWLRDFWVMMLRTKPQYLSVLGRKRSSIFSPEKLPRGEDKSWTSKLRSCVCVVIMCCSISYGIVLLLLQDVSGLTASTLLVPLIVGAAASVSGGLCLSEYIFLQSQEVPSIYSCCYQYSSEALAFFIGWTSIFSQAAMVAAICKVSAMLVNRWTENALLRLLENSFLTHADAIPSLAFVLVFVLIVITGLSETLVWYVLFIPLSFILVISSFAINHTSTKQDKIPFSGNWFEIQSVDQVLTASSLCLLFFSGPQNLLRISGKKVRQKTIAALGPLNAISFVVVVTLLCMASQSGKFFEMKQISNSPATIATNVLLLLCLCLLGIETFYPLHFVIEDMSTDGLLFRAFSKKRTPFCFPIASAAVQMICVIVIGLLLTFLPLLPLLTLTVVFPLTVNSLVPLLVLIQRYRDNNAWQYEPMFQSTAKSIRDRSRKKSEESQYTNGVGYNQINESIEMSTTCISEESAEEGSDTDIDSVVQQYKDQARIANMPILEEHDPSDQVPEPTPSSSFRAKLSITALLLTALINSLALNFADVGNHFSFVAVSLMCILFSTVIQGLLLCLPQNSRPSKLCCTQIPRMPWIPGMASLINTCLLVHCLLLIWKAYLGWLVLGFLIYFSYGIRSSTAANSFYNLQPAHINLCPLPSYGNKCIPQIVPSQRKKLKPRLNNAVRKNKVLVK